MRGAPFASWPPSCMSGADREPEEVEKHVIRSGSEARYEIAGVGPEDVSVAEVHDATAMGEISRSRTWASALSATAARSRRAERPGSAAASPSIRRGASNRKDIRSARRGWGRSTNSFSNCAARRVEARSPMRASRSPRTAAASTASRRPSPVSRSWPVTAAQEEWARRDLRDEPHVCATSCATRLRVDVAVLRRLPTNELSPSAGPAERVQDIDNLRRLTVGVRQRAMERVVT